MNLGETLGRQPEVLTLLWGLTGGLMCHCSEKKNGLEVRQIPGGHHHQELSLHNHIESCYLWA